MLILDIRMNKGTKGLYELNFEKNITLLID